MELYQRKRPDGSLLSPFWYYDIHVPARNGKTRRVRCSTKERVKAKAKEVATKALLEARNDATGPAKRRLLVDVVTDYVEDLKALRKPAWRTAQVSMERAFGLNGYHGKPGFRLPQSLHLDELNDRIVSEWRRARLKEGHAIATVACELSYIRAGVMRVQEDGGEVPRLRWNIPTAPSKTRWMTPEEWQRVYDELEPSQHVPYRDTTRAPSQEVVRDRTRARDLLVALTMCGGRWGEVSRLTVDQVLPDGKVKLWGWKTQKERIVPVPPQFAEVLVRRVAAAKEAGTPYLFPSKRGDKGWQQRSRSISAAINRAGLNEPHLVERNGRATIHSLRHTFASWLLQSGMDLAGVQDLLGHSTMDMTRRYAHLSKANTVEQATQTLAGIIQGRPLNGALLAPCTTGEGGGP